MNKGSNKGVIIHLGSVMFMSCSLVLNKFALVSIGPYEAAVVNSLFALVFTVGINQRFRPSAAAEKGPQNWKLLLPMGLANGAGLVLLFYSLNEIGPISVGFIGRFYIVFAILIGIAFLKERYGALEYGLMALVVAGTFAFSWNDEKSELWGASAAILFTLLFAVSNTLAQRARQTSSAKSVLLTNNISAFVFASVYFFLVESGSLSFDLAAYGYAVLSALLGSTIGLLLYYYGLLFLPFSKANIIRSLQPLFVAAIAFPFFPKTFTPLQVLSALVIFLSVIALSIVKTSRKPSHETR